AIIPATCSANLSTCARCGSRPLVHWVTARVSETPPIAATAVAPSRSDSSRTTCPIGSDMACWNDSVSDLKRVGGCCRAASITGSIPPKIPGYSPYRKMLGRPAAERYNPIGRVADEDRNRRGSRRHTAVAVRLSRRGGGPAYRGVECSVARTRMDVDGRSPFERRGERGQRPDHLARTPSA